MLFVCYLYRSKVFIYMFLLGDFFPFLKYSAFFIVFSTFFLSLR